jgi:glucose-6-phosphate isomerase
MNHFHRFESNVIATQELRYFYGFSDEELGSKSQIESAMANFKLVVNGEFNGGRVMHHECRKKSNRSGQLRPIQMFINKIQSEGVFDSICHIGIGGSISGVRFVSHALQAWKTPQLRPLHFISSHDEDHIDVVLGQLNIKKTLFVIVSKSGVTVEIQKILNSLQKRSSNDQFFKTQCVTVSTQGSPLMSPNYYASFSVDGGIGGRYSTTSISTLLTLALCYDFSLIDSFLDGALLADQHAVSTDMNIALTQAMIRYSQQRQYESLAVIPYGESMGQFPMYIMQLISESLGKRATIHHETLNAPVAPYLMVGVGPEAQHTFFQQLHQNPKIIPTEFFIVAPQQSNQRHMLQQVVGQMSALYIGKKSSNPTDHFDGKRPSTLTVLNNRSIHGLGYLVATIENRVIYEGILNGVNPFDQPGIELGKQLTAQFEHSSSVASKIIDVLLHKPHYR